MMESEMSRKEYWDNRAKAMNDENRADAEYAATPQGQLEIAERKLAALNAMRAEGDDRPEEIRQAEAKIEALRKAIEDDTVARFAAEWTIETTRTRMTAWNQLVKSGKLSKDGKVWWSAVREAEKVQGWTMEDLQKAVKAHGLGGAK